jgi:putative DNA primase/helicase
MKIPPKKKPPVRRQNARYQEEHFAWPSPKPLDDAHLLAPTLSPKMIPESLRPWLTDVARRLQCPLEFPTIAALISIGAVVGNRIGVRPKARDNSWTLVPNLWGAAVAGPGLLMKTPSLQAGMEPLEWLRRQVLKRTSGGGSPVPKPRRFIVNDTTVEKLGELLKENPRGLLLFRDELDGFITKLDSRGHESDRGFYLETWDALRSYSFDRIGRGTIHIPRMTLLILGGLQPDRLSRILNEISTGRRTNDGFIQRFQLLVFPEVPDSWENVDEKPNIQAEKEVCGILRDLEALNPITIGAKKDRWGHIPFLRFSPRAQRVFNAWYKKLMNEIRGGKIANQALRFHLSKYPNLMPNLALVFHLAQRIGGYTSQSDISVLSARRAVKWCRFLRSHAQKVYGLGADAEKKRATELRRHILKGDLHNPFTLRDVLRKCWSQLTDFGEVQASLQILERHNWIRSTTEPSGTQGGRPTTKYEINPKAIATE